MANFLIVIMVITVIPNSFKNVTIIAEASNNNINIKNPSYNADSNISIWDCIWFGKYLQTDTNEDGVIDKNDRKIPIKWRVLSVDGTDAFLLSDKALDAKPMNTINEYFSWSDCTLRSWLNGYSGSDNSQGIDYSNDNFLNEAFSEDEKIAIVKYNKVNNDRIYILSPSEMTNNIYGFSSNVGDYPYAMSGGSKSRSVKKTDYASKLSNAKGTWLRSSASYNSSTNLYYGRWMLLDGSLHPYYTCVENYAIRPCLHIDLSSVTWKYAGTVCSDGTNEEVEATTSLIVEAVEKYSNDNETLKKMLLSVNEKNLPYDVKMQLMNDICMRYGYTDVKEGIEYLNDASSAQIAYNALVNNESYACWNFGNYLNNTTKGTIARGLLYTSGLIFNDEIGDWMAPGTYLQNDYPGIKKYKTLLAKFIEDSADEFEVYTRANEVVDVVDDVIDPENIDGELEKNLEKLFEATSKEQEKLINDIFKKDKLTIVDGKYVTVRSEAWGKAFGIASKTLKLATDGVNDILAFINVSTRMKLYQEYDVFFEEIINGEDLPFELRAAAYFLRDEVESGYFEPIKDLLLHTLKNASDLQNKIPSQEVTVETGELEGLLQDAMFTIKIGTFCVNLLVDMGGVVKNAAYTNGYAYLTAFYTNLLEESREKFNNNKTQNNAWDFYYKYNMLYRLRIAGEETYLELNELSPDGIMGWGGYLLKYAFDYEAKKNLVDSNIKFLKEHCKFELPDKITVPEKFLFAQKAVISCPVDVEILDSDDRVIASIADGVISDITNDYGRFMCVYRPYFDDFAKIIYLNDNKIYKYRIIGKSEGEVSLQMCNETGLIKGFTNISMDKNMIVTAVTDDLVDTYGIDIDGNGTIDKQAKLEKETDNKINLLTSLSISDKNCELEVGENKQLLYQYEPLSALNSQVMWRIEDNSVAKISKSGLVTALNKGETIAYCISTSTDDGGNNIIKTCKIKVNNKKIQNGYVTSNCTHLFNDYNYLSPVSGSAVVIYGNGIKQKINGEYINNKQFVAYTDILTSYNYTTNSKGIVKPSTGKVIAGITKSDTKPVVTKNKIVDKEAAKIAKARIKNGQITVTATGKEKGLVYLWIIDTGSKGVSECCPINVQIAPRKLEVQDTSGNKLKSLQINNGESIDVNIAGIVSSNIKTDDCTYTATVSSGSQNYITVTPVSGTTSQFKITGTGLKNNKNTKASIIFICNENNRKVKFSVIVKK